MKIEFSKEFVKQLKKLKDKRLKGRVQEALQKLHEAESLANHAKVIKMKGFDNAYRLKVGDYRLGFFKEEEGLRFEIFAHRKKIYDVFP